jgi:hypothetical protein
MFCSIVELTMLNNKCIFKNKLQDFECFQHEVMNVRGDGYASYLDLIITRCILALKCHAVFHKYVQLLCIYLKKNQRF